MKLDQSIILVTGANRGLGRALVQAALERGARKVYATARDASTITATARVVPMQLDVEDAASLAAAAKQASDLTLLVNNAGTLRSGGVLAATPEQIASEFSTNVFGTLASTRAFAPALERNHGAVVNILSVVSLGNMPGLGIYSAAKAASYSLTQALRADLGKRGVRVHAALPGAIDTDMAKELQIPKTSAADVAAGILSGVEQGLDEILPDAMARDLYATWQRDPHELARTFASMG